MTNEIIEKLKKQSIKEFAFLNEYPAIDYMPDIGVSKEIRTIAGRIVNDDNFIRSASHSVYDLAYIHALTIKATMYDHRDRKCYVRIFPEITESNIIDEVGMYTRLIFM